MNPRSVVILVAQLARASAKARRLGWVALLIGLSGHAAAQMSASQIAEERGNIASERQQAKDKLDARLASCRHVFQTTKCVDDANAEWRHVRLQLNERTAVVDQIERKQRVAERLEGIEKNEAAKKKRDSDIEAETRGKAASEAADDDRGKRREESASASAIAASKAAAAAEDRRQDAANRCFSGQRKEAGRCVVPAKSAQENAQFDKKAAEAAEHRAAVRKRNAERDQAKIGKPLPIPAVIPPSTTPSPAR